VRELIEAAMRVAELAALIDDVESKEADSVDFWPQVFVPACQALRAALALAKARQEDGEGARSAKERAIAVLTALDVCNALVRDDSDWDAQQDVEQDVISLLIPHFVAHAQAAAAKAREEALEEVLAICRPVANRIGADSADTCVRAVEELLATRKEGA